MNITMKRLRRAALAAVALTAGAGSAGLLAVAPAGASSTQVTAVGSFTTFAMMQALFPQSVNNINPNALPYTDGLTTETIAPDQYTCVGGLTYSSASQPPNGSGQGKTALANEEGAGTTEQGCIDFARSSSPPEPEPATAGAKNIQLPSGFKEAGDPYGSHLDYYAYALDGVSVLLGSDSGSTAADPVTLTLTQAQEVYSCWNPFNDTPVTTWAQAGIGTSTDTIVRYWPQSGSGTRAVYTDVLGFDPTGYDESDAFNHCTSAPITSFTANSITYPMEENTEDGIIYNKSVNGADADADAFYIYSAGKFVSQWNNPTAYNSTAGNRVATGLGLGSVDIGNFDTSLTLAAFQACTTPAFNGVTAAVCDGQSHQYVSYTASHGHQGTMSINSATVAEPEEWYHNLPSNTGLNASDSYGPNSVTIDGTTTNGLIVPGIRYVYNVADTVLPGYNADKMLIGFDNQSGTWGVGTESALCHGDDAAIIAAQGFVPLSNNSGGTAPAGSDDAGATCREFPGGAFPGQAAPISYNWLPTQNTQDNN